MHRKIISSAGLVVFALALLALALPARAQTNLWIYTDHLVNGFQDWGWAPRNLANTNPVHAGSNSIAVTATLAPTYSNGIAFHYGNDFDTTVDINTSIYTNLSFWANGGTTGGQILQASVTLDSSGQPGFQFTTPLTASNWQKLTVPLSKLNAVGKFNLSTVTILLAGGSTNTFYIDDISLEPVPEPALTHLSVDASQTLRAADARWFGANTATWDGNLSSAQTIPMLQQMGVLTLRWPGGSTSDGYHWASDLSGNANFLHIVTNINAQTFITVNYGSGTSNEAAAWVSYANVTNHAGVKYWEIGNECYGGWEQDNNSVAHDPFTYATRAKNYAALMKAANPGGNIKIGVVLVPGETSYSNNANHFAINPRTGITNYGWTPVMLATLKSIGFTPDFAVYHYYPQYTSSTWQPNVPDSDALLLQTATNWAHDAADLRQQLTDYMGTNGAGIELVCTENNSDAGSMGQQSTSVVNALYLADSASQLMKTEFNAYIWWDLRNGSDTSGAFDPTLYGWRSNGDYGFLSGPNSPYPIFYAEKLLQYFVRPGDTILNAGSDNAELSCYAARKADGALSMLIINKTPTNILNAQISLTNFIPAGTSTMRSYGQAQDNAAAANNNTPGVQDIYTNVVASAPVFTRSFPPYTLTLLNFPPAQSQLRIVSRTTNQIVLQIQGQAGVSYVLQSSTNLILGGWTSISTNLLTGPTANATNQIAVSSLVTYWRAVWLP